MNYVPKYLTRWFFLTCTAVLPITLIPSQIFYGDSIWGLSTKYVMSSVGFAAAYLITISLIAIRTHKTKTHLITHIAPIIFTVFGAYCILILLANVFYSRPYLLSALVFAITYIVLSLSISRNHQIVVLTSALIITILMQSLGKMPGDLFKQATSKPSQPTYSSKKIDTALYSLRVSFFENYICPLSDKNCTSPRNGGGISLFGPGYLLATGEGLLYYFNLDLNNHTLDIKSLPLRIPLNSESFESSGDKDTLWLFRVTDILVKKSGDKLRLFAAHHHWNTDEQCFTLMVSSIEATFESFTEGKLLPEWQTVFNTSPCLPLREPLSNSHNTRYFSGDESGGRMVLLDNNKILLSVGDHLFNGFDRKEMLAQDNTSSYGKTILIDINSGTGKTYTSGHRNPQGLHVDAKGSIWLTEHGPRGGDELNLLTEGANYGWPLVTYGTDYGKKSWPLNKIQGEHDGFQRSLYSWVPSTAVSSLIRLKGSLFNLWQGDFLIGSYKKILWRIRVREGRVAYAEPIKLRGRNLRIRDLVEDNSGRVVLWLDNGTITVLEPDSHVPSNKPADKVSNKILAQELFLSQCAGCHSSADNSDSELGPNLSKVLNREIGSLEDYAYSKALKNIPGSWTAQNLDQFIANPKSFAAGNAMNYKGLADEIQRAMIIDYLNSL